MRSHSMNHTRARLVSRLALLLSSTALLGTACAGAEPEIEEESMPEESTADVASALTTTGAQRFTAVGNGLGAEFGHALAVGHFNSGSNADLAIQGGTEEVELRLGTSGGVSTSPTTVSQDTAGVPGVTEEYDYFGEALAAGDFNGDGVDDVAIGVPCESWSGYSCAGAVNVIYNTPVNGSPPSPQMFYRGNGGVPGAMQAYEHFGHALAVGNFDGDEYADLAIGCPYRNAEAGAVIVIYGGPNGLDGSTAEEWSQGTSGIAGSPEAGDRFGFALAAGDFDGDSYSDLAVGSPDESLSGGPGHAGAVNVIYGASGGLSSSGNQIWTGDGDGLSYAPGGGNLFGYALAAGAFNTDGKDDLVIGVPFLNVGSEGEAGGVVVMFGGNSGLGLSNDQTIHQDSNKVAGAAESGDRCGWAVAVGDVNDDGWGDIVFGCPGESVVSGEIANGAINVNFGPFFTSSLSLTGEVWHQDSTGVPGDPVEGGYFGYSLAVGDFNGDTVGDVAIGAYELGGGSVTILRGN